ncbi:MAG: EamA family transporter [Eubacterium sp.]|nr:EamA family transporter [Eubacterium sp.]
MIKYVLIFLLSVLISSISQIVLKTSANEEHGSFIRELLNIKVIVAYGLFFGATLITMYAYKQVPLSLGAVLEATGYVYVALLGRLILKEKLGRNRIIGNLLIVIGILIFALG